MITKICLFFAMILIGGTCLSIVPVFAEEADMQEKYGYYLMDVPAEAKQDYYSENNKKWEDTIYSERLLFLRKWEIDVKNKDLRKERLKNEIEKQKQEEKFREQYKQMEKQRKIMERKNEASRKELEKEQEKARIKQKHNTIFKKMLELRNEQKGRDGSANP